MSKKDAAKNLSPAKRLVADQHEYFIIIFGTFNTRTLANHWLGPCVLGKDSKRKPNANVSNMDSPTNINYQKK
jgi:hypothetical protein